MAAACDEPNPYNVQPDGYAIITGPLSLYEDENATVIPRGSTIYHWANGITEAYGPDGERLFIARDADAAAPAAPGGPKPATYLLQVPDKAQISEDSGNITRVYLEDNLILTVIKKAEDYIP